MRRGQRGAALLMAMIIVSLIATMAAAMVWQQWRAVQVEAAERDRTQAAWVLVGALDFARLILNEDNKAHATMTALSEPWATPLQESRLSTFLSADASSTDGPEAFLSGSIADAQGRFNIMNLITSPATPPVAPDPTQVETLGRLCQSLGLDVSIASRIAAGLLQASASPPAANAPLLPIRVSQLTWFGVDQASVEALSPYIEVLDKDTPLNVNTASKETLAAVMDIDPATAQRLVAMAAHTPFRSPDLFRAQIPNALTTAKIDVFSRYFEVYGRLRLADRVLTERTLIKRNAANLPMTVLDQERVSSVQKEGSGP